MSEKGTSQRKKGRRRRASSIVRDDYPVIVSVGAVMAVLDFVSFKWFVPWADEMTDNQFMSLGYIVTFFVIFCNFIIFFALLAYLLQRESYPSDRWQ